MQRDPQYVHREEALQIFELLNSSEECPLIAITGNTGSGRSTLCFGIQKLQRNYKNTMQFFYVPLADCKRWDEFCMQLYQKMNIAESEIPEPKDWRKAAKRVAERCGGYWRSVVILDQLDELKDADGDIWEIIKKLLCYWKSHQTRVLFTCRNYPKGLSCYVWHIGELKNEEAKMVFFSACTSKRYRNTSLLEQKVVSELFDRQAFRPAAAHLLGSYANSKNDLNGLLEEWELYHQPGDNEGQILARILWNHLLEEHKYAELTEQEQKNKVQENHLQEQKDKVQENHLQEQKDKAQENHLQEQKDKVQEILHEKKYKIKENILWVWGVLGNYPGVFPSVFFESILQDSAFRESKDLTKYTLIFMKNAGLCEELGDERQSVLLNNIVYCAENYFLKRMSEYSVANPVEGRPDPEVHEKLKEIYESFRQNAYASEKKYFGQRCFRGYSMDNYNGQLRDYVLQEIELKEDRGRDPINDILDILECLGKQAETDSVRAENKKLNLVLRYEIKTVVRFLRSCLLRKDIDDEKMRKAVQAAYRFAHYFHYVPEYSMPLVLQLLEIMKDTDRRHLYQLANLNRVMGDIKRQMGRKKEAADYYQVSLRLCNEQLLAVQGELDQDHVRNECRRIKAGVLLAGSDFKTLPGGMEKSEYSLKIYEKIEDKWGQAYYHQRKGDMLFGDAMKTHYGYNRKRKDCFDEIRNHYNQSIELYEEKGDKTAMAYILKCMGDLIEKMNDVYQNDNVYLKRQEKNSIFYTIERNDGSDRRYGDYWIYDAVCCYTQAFIYYYGHVNWRGFANVLQAMGTMYREVWVDQKKEIECAEKLYGLAEECYRWLGDMGGLADTLDYFGYVYEDSFRGRYKECPDDRYAYMALGKWMESREIWKGQGNEEKAEQIDRKIRCLRKELEEKIRQRSKNQNMTEKENGGAENE